MALDVLVFLFGIGTCNLDVLVISFVILRHYQSVDQQIDSQQQMVCGSRLKAHGQGGAARPGGPRARRHRLTLCHAAPVII